MNNKNKTVTITSKDVNKSKKIKVSPILGYKIQTTTMGVEHKEDTFTKEAFESALRKISRPLTKDDEEKR